jgi:excisionase family DNA binding protein
MGEGAPFCQDPNHREPSLLFHNKIHPLTTIKEPCYLIFVVEGCCTMADKPRIEPGAVYSRQEAAEALGISLSTLKRLVRKGHLKISKPQGMRRVFITGESILAMLQETAIEKGA